MPLLYVGVKFSEKLCDMMREHEKIGTCSRTFGTLDTVQVVVMARYLTTVYVCGWQSSSTFSTSNEPGPDVAACTAALGDKIVRAGEVAASIAQMKNDLLIYISLQQGPYGVQG